jgi:hypothetical protein
MCLNALREGERLFMASEVRYSLISSSEILSGRHLKRMLMIAMLAEIIVKGALALTLQLNLLEKRFADFVKSLD